MFKIILINRVFNKKNKFEPRGLFPPEKIMYPRSIIGKKNRTLELGTGQNNPEKRQQNTYFTYVYNIRYICYIPIIRFGL